MSNFPDYEAAARMIHQCRNLGAPPKRLPDIEAAKLIVDVGLNDEPLYEKHPCDGDHYIPEGARCLEPTWVRVWSKEDNDES